MNSREIALLTARTIDQKKGTDIVVIDIAARSSFADYMILASGGSQRQIAAIADEAEDALAAEGLTAKNIEGRKESGWILMDYGDVIISVLTSEMRDRYNIEKVWGDCDKLPLDI